jgi:tRNA1(Val) A37 N6-methylase TrmN6
VLRPAGWVAPGPRPNPEPGADLAPREDEDLSYLLGDFRIFQKKSGHRWSLDDFVTAFVALAAVKDRPVKRALDLGTGIGSVLLMLAWSLEDAHLLGVEAQETSFGLAQRSIRYNGLSARVSVRHGDFRATRLEEGAFDLVTGTPPYMPLGSGRVSDKVQRGPCHFETRGGVADYARIAARVLAPHGRFVVCSGLANGARLGDAAAASGLHLVERVVVVPREGKQPLLDVGVFQHAPAPRIESTFTVRDETGALTAEMHEARQRMGLPPLSRA